MPRTGLGARAHRDDATLAAVTLDRFAMTSIRIDIDGPSYRAPPLARQRAKDPGIVDDST